MENKEENPGKRVSRQSYFNAIAEREMNTAADEPQWTEWLQAKLSTVADKHKSKRGVQKGELAGED